MVSWSEDDNEKPVWRIVWMITRGGRTDYGEPYMTYEQAVGIARAKNVEYGNRRSYWVQHRDEPVPQN
jgi:hypothetical protein